MLTYTLSISLDTPKWWGIAEATELFFLLKAEVSKQVFHGWLPFLIGLSLPKSPPVC